MDNTIVPYRDRENPSNVTILQHENALVLYNPTSHQLVLRHTSPAPILPSQTLQPTCPLCHQEITPEIAEDIHRRDSTSHHRRESSTGIGGISNGLDDDDLSDDNINNSVGGGGNAGFITPEYFRILNTRLLPDSLGNSNVQNHLSPPGSPRKRIPGIEGERRMSGSVGSGNGSPSGSIRERLRSRSSSTHGISSNAFSAGYFENFFVTEKELGRGGKGVVLLVRHVLDGVTLGKFACKRVPVGDDHEWLAKVLMEVQLLQQLSHQNLVSYRHAWLENAQLTNFGPAVPCAFILQQYCNAGDLHNYVYTKRAVKTNEELKDQMRLRRMSKGHMSHAEAGPKLLPFEQIISFFRDIASGLNHLHTNGFIHRDLKPSNCLLHDNGNEIKVLVSDFGEVQIENAARRSTGATGTISYCAPEVLKRVGPNGEFGNFSFKSDIFSLGMILHFMCFGKLPYINADEENEENEEIDKLRAEISAWVGYNDKYRSTRADIPDKMFKNLARLLSVEPTKRPSAADILTGLRTEFGFGEDGIPLRNPTSPKPTNIGIADDGRFNRISPVPSGASTPVLNSSSLLTRKNKPKRPKATPTIARSHSRPASNLREITSQLDLSESIISSEERGNSSGAPLSSDSSDSSDEGAMIPQRSLSSSLILRPKKNNEEISSITPKTPTAITAPSSPVKHKVPNWVRPQSWLLLKMLLFFFKIVIITNRCAPVAPNPWVFNSLLLLALLDLFGPFLKTTLALLAVHLTALFVADRWNVICTTNELDHGRFLHVND